MSLTPKMMRQCWFLAGPTACGKTAVSLALAESLDAEIVALDSMTLYRGMDIGTAKPTPAEQARVPHHLLDLLEPEQEFSVAEYLEVAAAAVSDILDRGRTPLFVGGAGLYLRSMLRGVFDGPAADWEFRRALEQQADREATDWLHRQLQSVDAASAARLHPADRRRLIRALEIHHLTGRPATEQRLQAPLPEAERPPHVYWLSPPRDWLYERINLRVEAMLQLGLVEEVRGLLRRPGGLGRTARQGLGYKEVIAHLEQGLPLEEMVEQLKARTRQFAKRQHTWFRNLIECQAVTVHAQYRTADLVERLLARRL
ncbi:MAG: tRNA (adenosine(37)-N6)-dimethylallyltransferase MiaA [Planctomycetaceae bacterium]